MKRGRWAALAIATGATGVFAAARPDSDAAWRVETRVEAAAETGTTTYRMGGTVIENGVRSELPFPISRLVWPLPRWTARVAGEARHRSRWEFFGAVSAAPSQQAGKLADTDWEAPGAPTLATTYSESKTAARGLETEAGVRRYVYEWTGERDLIALSAGVGLAFRRHDWVARDASQWHPPFPELGVSGILGDVATYRTTVWTPYLEIAGTWRRAAWECRGRLALSPYVRAEDRDDHLARGLESRASTEGVGGKAELHVRRAIGRRTFACVHLYYSAFAAEGVSRNLVYADYDPETPFGARWIVDQEIVSEQMGASLGVGAQF